VVGLSVPQPAMSRAAPPRTISLLNAMRVSNFVSVNQRIRSTGVGTLQASAPADQM
jgi:hypothetical protein